MTGNPPREGLKMKTSTSITGGACCPHCGGLLPAADAVFCSHCRKPVHARPAPVRVAARGPGLFSGLVAVLGSVSRFVLFLVVVAVLAVGGMLAYQHGWPGASPVVPAPVPARPSSPCAACQGSGEARCPVCGGAGRVDGVQVHTPCDQCGGTGLYQHKLKRGTTRCPFCRGTGTKGTHQARVACASCEGKGFIACPTCGGTGRTSADAGRLP
jgi:hypothetical protein